MKEGEQESLWKQLKWGLVLGGSRFAEQARQKVKVSRESPGQRSLRRRRSWEELVAGVGKLRPAARGSGIGHDPLAGSAEYGPNIARIGRGGRGNGLCGGRGSNPQV